MKRVQVAVLAAALTGSSIAPASAIFGPMPVIDASALLKLAAQVKQTLSLVQSAQQNLQALPSGIGMSNVLGRISNVTSILHQAQTACRGAVAGKVLPSACQVEASTAQAQAAQLGSEMAQVQALQSAANSVGGGLAANQLQAKALVEIATQLQESRQAQTAAALQRQIDDNALDSALHGPPAIKNPYGP